ncbi:YggS family pyridoxal phosphate-dependent enzyme [Hydrogenophilus thiooxidans]|uniref:YggS family pyridoxal phosphate-dependent enzyme n=1 Tax=Hydrogenophilus thiooxidans TaxID=2820326 RepID=UPI001C241C69|nr:YggS family pyridoxal phosphate-dependent enzyme [Hydrogenophilus thiooxidans]
MSEDAAAAIAARVAAVRAQIAEAAARLGRDPATVTLVAVSKTQPAAAIRAAFAAGLRVFGENYVQEAVAKQAELADLPIEWHFIGPIQRNKTRAIAAAFDWVHSLDRLEVAQRFAEQRDPARGPLNVMVQVNVSGEASKAGVAPEAVVALAKAIAHLPQLNLVGLMTIPEPSADPELLARRFRTVRELRDTLQREGLPVWALSMGMSSDWSVALAEGATHLRIGSALFGPRPRKTPRPKGGGDASGEGAKTCG